MKLNKLYIGLAMLAGVFSACSDSDESIAPGNWDAADGFYNIAFPQTSISMELDPIEETTAKIEIKRRNTSGAATVPFEIVENTDNVFDVQAAEFADGEETAFFTLNFPKAEIGTKYTLQIKVSDPQFTSVIYSQDNSVSFDVTRVKWNDTGYFIDSNGERHDGWALYTEDFLTTFYGIDNVVFPTRLQERDDRPGYFRMVNTYGELFPYNDPGDWDESQDYYIYIDATNPDKVYIPMQCHTGMTWSYGAFRMFSLAGYYLNKEDKDKAEDYYGTYANGKITFPAGALLISMDDYNSGGMYSSNVDGKFCLVVDPSKDLYVASIENDCEWESVYEGEFHSAQLGATTTATLYKGTITTTTDDCDVRFAEAYGTPYRIGNPWGTGADLVFCTKDGKIYLPEENQLQYTGMQAVGSKVYAKINTLLSKFSNNEITLNITYQNESGSIEYGTVEEKLINIPMTPVATGDYTYEFFGAVDNGLTLSQRDDLPDVYVISDWGFGVKFSFTWDKTTNKVMVDEQYTGYDSPSYGAVYVSDIPSYDPKATYEDYPCVYDPETKTFTFNLIYYCSAGYFGDFTETFTITSDQVAAASARATERVSKTPANIVLKKNSAWWNKVFTPKKVDFKTMTKTPTPFMDFGF
ncbi:MAG: hypothetical protein ACI3ZD_11370 [Prevotella sp.]